MGSVIIVRNDFKRNELSRSSKPEPVHKYVNIYFNNWSADQFCDRFSEVNCKQAINLNGDSPELDIVTYN